MLPQTRHRDNSRFDEAAEANIDHNEANLGDEFEGLTEELFNCLDAREPEGYNWSLGYSTLTMNWLQEVTTLFYSETDTSTEHVELFEYNKYCPQKCMGNEQKYLIYHHLWVQYCWIEYSENNNNDIQPPPSCFNFVEGKPGTGKSFVINTIQNTNRKIHKTNKRDMTLAPTGCAAALVNGATHFRAFSIPTGSKFRKQPTNLSTSQATKVTSFKNRMSHLFTQLMDEHSMWGRSGWGWIKHRCEESRRPSFILNDIGDMIMRSDTHIPEIIYK